MILIDGHEPPNVPVPNRHRSTNLSEMPTTDRENRWQIDLLSDGVNCGSGKIASEAHRVSTWCPNSGVVQSAPQIRHVLVISRAIQV
jgi:hypothetical protein